MSELVLLHHNEPMTTSLTLAEGVQMAHASVIKLVRKYIEDLQKFGPLGFEIHVVKRKQGGGDPAEVAFLNEGQSIFLLTLMRNSEIVVRFKVALVQAFLELRDRLAVSPAPTFETRNLSHGADLAVAADRTFRGFLRSARSAGLRLPLALKVANRQTIARTGMDMLAELGVVPEDAPADALPFDPYGVTEFVRQWLAGTLPVPATHCRSTDLYAAYGRWCATSGRAPAAPNVFGGDLRGAAPEARKQHVWVRSQQGHDRTCVRAVVLIGEDAYGGRRGWRMAEEFDRFAAALDAWA